MSCAASTPATAARVMIEPTAAAFVLIRSSFMPAQFDQEEKSPCRRALRRRHTRRVRSMWVAVAGPTANTGKVNSRALSPATNRASPRAARTTTGSIPAVNPAAAVEAASAAHIGARFQITGSMIEDFREMSCSDHMATSAPMQEQRPNDRRARLKSADLLSSTGALVLGVGLGALLADYLGRAAVPVLVAGVVSHGWGMLHKHRLEQNADDAPPAWWETAFYGSVGRRSRCSLC